MKSQFPKLVESGRVTVGNQASPTGADYGMFHVPHPDTGHLFRIIASSGMGWDHVSVSRPDRCPTWEEMCWVKGLFWNPEETVVQYHPPESQAVNLCPTCLHLWRPTTLPIPLPPRECV